MSRRFDADVVPFASVFADAGSIEMNPNSSGPGRPAGPCSPVPRIRPVFSRSWVKVSSRGQPRPEIAPDTVNASRIVDLSGSNPTATFAYHGLPASRALIALALTVLVFGFLLGRWGCRPPQGFGPALLFSIEAPPASSAFRKPSAPRYVSEA